MKEFIEKGDLLVLVEQNLGKTFSVKIKGQGKYTNMRVVQGINELLLYSDSEDSYYNQQSVLDIK